MRPRDGLARGLCALPARPRLASGRLPGCWPQRLAWRGAELGCSFRGGLPPFPRRARLRALPPSPRRAPPSGSHPSGNFSGGRGARSRAPRLRRGRLRAGRAPLHPRCLCGLPPGLWPCALRLPRRVRRPRPAARVAPVVWWSGASGEGGSQSSSVSMGGRARARWALRSPPWAAIKPETMQKSPRSDQKRGDREIPNSQTASRTAENGLSKVIAPPVGAVWVALAARSDVVHVVPPAIRANVVDLARAPHPAHVEFAIRWALVGQDHQADFVKARKAGRDGCPFVRRPCLRFRRCSLRFRHAPTPSVLNHRPHPVYTGRGWGSKHFLSFFVLKNRSPRSSTRRLSRKRSAPRPPGL